MMAQYDKLPYYIYLVIRPDANTAYMQKHEQYPLQLQADQLLTLGSTLYNLNTMQNSIIHPDIVQNRKEEIDISKNTSIKSINASTYQIRFLDTVSGYMFILAASHTIDSRKLDNKLEELYKVFVNYAMKAPLFQPSSSKYSELFQKKCKDILYL